MAKLREENERLPTKSVLKSRLGGESCLSFPKPRGDTASSSTSRGRGSGRCTKRATSLREGALAIAHSNTRDAAERRKGGGQRSASLPSKASCPEDRVTPAARTSAPATGAPGHGRAEESDQKRRNSQLHQVVPERERKRRKGEGQGQEERSSLAKQLEGQPERQTLAEKQVRQMSSADWFSYMKTWADNPQDWPTCLGLALRYALLRAPSSWGSASRFQRMQILTAFLSPEVVTAAVKEHGDLLPLPLDISAEDEAWDSKSENYLRLAKEAEPARREANLRAWVQALVMALNSFYEAPQSFAQGSKSGCFEKLNASGARAVESEALRLLRRKVELFLDAMEK